MNKKLLIHCRKPPYGNSLAREAIDMALAAAAFEQELVLLFSDDGVFQLLKDQNPTGINYKNHGKALSALPLYGVDQIYVCEKALSQRQVTTQDLVVSAQAISQQAIKDLLAEQTVILNF